MKATIKWMWLGILLIGCGKSPVAPPVANSARPSVAPIALGEIGNGAHGYIERARFF